MPPTSAPVLVAVVRRVASTDAAAMEEELRAFLAYAAQQPGYEGMQILRREAADTVEFTVLARFADAAARAAFKAVPDYPAWLARLNAHALHPVAIQELHGLEAWFAVPATGNAPPRWKMAVITYVGVSAVILTLGPLTDPWLASVPYPWSPLVLNVAVVASLTWLVMPRLTRLTRTWLHS